MYLIRILLFQKSENVYKYLFFLFIIAFWLYFCENHIKKAFMIPVFIGTQSVAFKIANFWLHVDEKPMTSSFFWWCYRINLVPKCSE